VLAGLHDHALALRSTGPRSRTWRSPRGRVRGAVTGNMSASQGPTIPTIRSREVEARRRKEPCVTRPQPFAVRKRPPGAQDGVDDGEDGGVPPDAERQRQDSRQREGWPLPQYASYIRGDPAREICEQAWADVWSPIRHPVETGRSLPAGTRTFSAGLGPASWRTRAGSDERMQRDANYPRFVYNFGQRYAQS
jgi:hypothetical protein